MKKVPVLNDIELDLARYRLGKLCKRKHDWRETGKSLRYVDHANCIICNQQAAEERYTRTKRTGTGAIPWNPDEDEVVRSNYGVITSKQMEKLLPGRSFHAIRGRAHVLGVNAQKPWSEEDLEFLRDNYGKVSNSTLAKLLNRTVSAVGAQAGYIGLSVSDKKWTKDEDSRLTNLYGKISRAELAKLFGTTKPSVQHRATKLGLTKPRQWYEYNKDFFADLTPLNCYWAGFMATDGCVVRKVGKKGEGLQISLSVKDIEHIYQFASDANATSPVKIFQPKVTKRVQGKDIVGGKAAKIVVYCCQWVDDLERNFNIVPAKTYTLEPPTSLTGDLAIAYIAGFIDGDGSINTDSRFPSQVGVSMSSASKDVLDWIKSIIDVECPKTDFMNLTGMALSEVREDERQEGYAPHWCYGFHGARARQMALRVFAMNLPVLDRKWCKIKAILDTPLFGLMTG